MQEIIEESKMLELTVIERRIKSLEKELEELEQREAVIKDEMMTAMTSNEISTFENEELKITYVKPVVRNSIDTNKLKVDYPDVYKDCLKTSETKGSIRIKVKEN